MFDVGADRRGCRGPFGCAYPDYRWPLRIGYSLHMLTLLNPIDFLEYI